MPLYEYRCQECENRFERIEKASAIHDGVCPVCGGVARRLLGSPALQFKGSGWYVTDYGKGNGSRPKASDSSSKTSDSSSGADTTAPTGKDTKTSTSQSTSKVA